MSPTTGKQPQSGDGAWTKGPWHVEGPDAFGDWNIHHPADRLAIGAVVSNLRPPAEVAANAYIFGASHDLYDALSALLKSCEAHPAFTKSSNVITASRVRAAHAALAKARGDIPVERAIDHLTRIVADEAGERA